MSKQQNSKTRWGLALSIALVLLGVLALFVRPALAVTTVHDVNAKWVKVSDDQTISDDGLITTSTSTVRMQIGFSTSGNDPIEPEELKIYIPRNVFRMHDGKNASIEYPWQTNGDYRVIDDPESDTLVITNRIRLNAATQQSIDITYNVGSGWNVWGNTENEPFKIRVELPGVPPKESTELRTKFVNHTEIKHVKKDMGTLYTTWQDGWDASKKPENADDYWYGVWDISFGTTDKTFGETGSSSQAVKIWLEDNQTDGMIVGYSKIREGNYSANLSELTDTIEEIGDRTNTEDGYAAPQQNYSMAVIVAYPKTMFQGSDPVTVTNNVTMHLKNDSDPWQEVPTTGTYTFENIAWYDYTPDGAGTDAQKHGIKWVYGGVTMLDNGVNADGLDFRVSADAYNITPGPVVDDKNTSLVGDEFSMVLNDDLLYVPLKDGPMRLGEGDYEASGFTVRFSTSTVEADFTSGKWKTVTSNWARLAELNRNPVVTVSGYKPGTGWVEIAQARHIPTHNEEGTDRYGSIEFFKYDESLGAPDGTYHFTLNEGTGFTRLQWKLVANQGVTEPASTASNTFDPRDHVLYADLGNHGNHGQFFRQNWVEYNAVADSYGCAYEVRLLHDGPNVQRALEEYNAGTAGGDDIINPGGGAVEGPNGEEKPLYVDNVISYFLTKNGKVVGTNDTGTSVAADDYYRPDVFSWDLATYATGDEKVEFAGKDAGTAPNSEDGAYVVHRIGRNYLTRITMGSGMGKSVSTVTGGDFGQRYARIINDSDNKRVMVPWVISANSWFAGEPEGLQNLQEAGLFELLGEGVIYDLLPLGMTLEESSLIVRVPGESSIESRTLVRGTDYFVEHVPNYKDSGQELIIIRYKYDNPLTNYTPSNGHVTSRIEVYMRTYYGWDSIYDYGDTFHNLAAFETAGSFLPDGEYSIPTSEEFTEEEKTLLTGLDPNYTEIDGETPRRFHYTRSKDVTINELTQARYGLSKLILGPESPYWGTGRVDEKDNQILIPTGGLYQYRLRYAPSEGTGLRDMILYDAIETYDPDQYTPEKIEERQDTDGTPADDEDVGTVRWKGTLLSIDVTQPKNVIGVAPGVYITCTEGFTVGELAAQEHGGKVPTYHDNKNLDPSNPEGSQTEWVKIDVDPHTNVATIPDQYKGKVTGIAIDMRTGKNGAEFKLDKRKSVVVILNMQGPTEPAEIRRLINEAAALADNEGNTSATLPYTYNGVSMNAILKHSNGTEDPGAVITNYYTRLTLRIPYGSIEVSKKVEGVEDASDMVFGFKASATDVDGSPLDFAGTYYILDVATGHYVDANGGLVNADGYPVDAEGNVGSDKVDPSTYTHTTSDGTFSFKVGQRARLVDAIGDIPWTVTETTGTDGFDTSVSVNGAEAKQGTTSDSFVIGDKQQANVAFTNTAYGELRVSKTVDSGSKSEDFEFTLTLTKDDAPVVGEVAYTGEGGKADGTLVLDEEGKATFTLKDGEAISLVLDCGTSYELSEAVPVGYEEPQVEGASGTIVHQEPAEATFINNLTPGEGPDKKIVDPASEDLVDHLDLSKYDDPVTYVVSAKIPGDAVKIVVTDTIAEALEFVGSSADVVVEDEQGTQIEGAEISISGKTLTVEIAGTDGVHAIPLRGQTIRVSFQAKLSQGADLAPYATTGQVLIPNTAEVSFNDNPALSTQPTTITPPGEEPEPEKKVEGASHADLESATDSFSYEITGYVPANANKIVFTDTLEDVLAFVGDSSDVHVLDGEVEVEGAVIDISGKTLTVSVENTEEHAYLTPHRTHTLRVVFDARIVDGADLSSYVVEGAVSIPNTATYDVDDKGAVRTEPVTVTPPEEEPTPDKDVNGKNSYTLVSKGETFSYSISNYVPANATKLVVSDRLDDLLSLQGDKAGVKVTDGNGKAVEGATITVEGQKITVSLDEEAVAPLRTRHLVVSFSTKLREDADLSSYADKTIPNKATVVVNNEPAVESDTAEVHTPKKPKVVPSTGDATPLAAIAALGLAGAAFATLAAMRKSKERAR